jgi:hypothetical protein
MKDYLAGECYWRDPSEYPPPLGIKMMLLNPDGVATIGQWTPWFIAWAALPKVPRSIKEKMLSRYSSEPAWHLEDMA